MTTTFMSASDPARRHLSSSLCLLAALAACPAQAAQRCALTLPGGGTARIVFDERGGVPRSFAMNMERAVDASAHECSLAAKRGDGTSRWRGGAPAYATVRPKGAEPYLLSFYRYQGTWQLGVTALDGGDADCGTFSVPATILLTPKPDGRCVARLPKRAAFNTRKEADSLS